MAVPFPFLLLCLLSQLDFFGADSCLHPIFVRWPRVRLRPQAQGAATKNGAILPLADCQKACADNKQPTRGGGSLQCSAFNHRPAGHGSYEGDCQLFSREHVQHTDGYMEADDRYTFYWKYCIDVVKSCTGEYAFTFLSDRFMHRSEVVQTKYTKSLEECLAECLENGKILCRSVSFNRTDGGCHLSEQNQLSKPASVTINNNPNYRIDYYENNCYNNSFTFASFCEADGIRVRVDSRIPYTGALYGLYDFFSCRLEPREQRHFELLFPYPHLARNCSDSMRQAGQDVVLEVVLSTDGVEPLYFITGDDLTYQARCPVPKQASKSISLNHVVEEQTARVDEFFRLAEKEAVDQRSRGASVQTILEALGSSSGGPSSSRRFESSSSSVPLSTTAGDGNTGPSSTGTSFTKDVFTLPLYTLVPAPAGPHKDSAPEQPGRAAQLAGIGTTNPWLAAADAAKSAERPPTTAVPSNRSELASPATSTSSSSAPEAGDRSTQPKQQQQQQPTRATTLIVQQQQQPAELLDGWNGAGHRRKGPAGMEPIFDEADEPPKFPSSTSTATSSSPLAYSPESTATAKTTTKRAASFGEEWRDGTREFSFSTHLAFPSGNKIQLQTSPEKDFPSQSPTTTTTAATAATTNTTTSGTTTTTTTTSVQTTATPLPTPTSSIESASSRRTSESDATSPRAPPEQRGSGQREKIIFEIFHNGQPAEAVVVGSRITLAFTPYFAIPPSHMSISGCQVEPIGSLYEWEKEPLAIIKEGCQADHVGLVCPPQKTDYGIRVTVEAFRYQTTTQVQYTCLVRVCPFASCAQITCPPVEGCPGEDIVSRTFGLRAKRQGFGRPAQQQLNGLPVADSLTAIQQQTRFQQPGNVPALQQQLISLGGDSLVRRRLIVVNSDDELRYYARTGELPQAAGL